MTVAITFHIPGALREFTGGRGHVQIQVQIESAATLADALSTLWALYPGLRDRIVTEQGQVREHINIFIGSEHIRYRGGLSAPVQDGAEVFVISAVSGG